MFSCCIENCIKKKICLTNRLQCKYLYIYIFNLLKTISLKPQPQTINSIKCQTMFISSSYLSFMLSPEDLGGEQAVGVPPSSVVRLHYTGQLHLTTDLTVHLQLHLSTNFTVDLQLHLTTYLTVHIQLHQALKNNCWEKKLKSLNVKRVEICLNTLSVFSSS